MAAASTTIGQSVVITGDLSAQEDLTIEGQVEGTVQLDENTVTVGPKGRVTADIQAQVVDVQGQVTGQITATETLTLGHGGTVQGDLRAPRIGIAEGAMVTGTIDTQRSKTKKDSAGRSAPRGPQTAAAAR